MSFVLWVHWFTPIESNYNEQQPWPLPKSPRKVPPFLSLADWRCPCRWQRNHWAIVIPLTEQWPRSTESKFCGIGQFGRQQYLHIQYQAKWLILATNKVNIVKLGGLEPLIRLMTSSNVEVQCNAVGCITNLATHGLSPFILQVLNFRWK